MSSLVKSIKVRLLEATKIQISPDKSSKRKPSLAPAPCVHVHARTHSPRLQIQCFPKPIYITAINSTSHCNCWPSFLPTPHLSSPRVSTMAFFIPRTWLGACTHSGSSIDVWEWISACMYERIKCCPTWRHELKCICGNFNTIFAYKKTRVQRKSGPLKWQEARKGAPFIMLHVNIFLDFCVKSTIMVTTNIQTTELRSLSDA